MYVLTGVATSFACGTCLGEAYEVVELPCARIRESYEVVPPSFMKPPRRPIDTRKPLEGPTESDPDSFYGPMGTTANSAESYENVDVDVGAGSSNGAKGLTSYDGEDYDEDEDDSAYQSMVHAKSELEPAPTLASDVIATDDVTYVRAAFSAPNLDTYVAPHLPLSFAPLVMMCLCGHQRRRSVVGVVVVVRKWQTIEARTQQ